MLMVPFPSLETFEHSPKLEIMRKLITPLQYWLYLKFNYPLFLWIWFSRDYVGEIYRHIFSWFEFVTTPGTEAGTHSSPLTKDFIANKNSKKKSFCIKFIIIREWSGNTVGILSVNFFWYVKLFFKSIVFFLVAVVWPNNIQLRTTWLTEEY